MPGPATSNRHDQVAHIGQAWSGSGDQEAVFTLEQEVSATTSNSAFVPEYSQSSCKVGPGRRVQGNTEVPE